jgi:hypothetical protein
MSSMEAEMKSRPSNTQVLAYSGMVPNNIDKQMK